ncbi:TPA: hypothetical protein ACXM51_000883 [Stenotrophomonas maltophilia]|nr:hypothetical protein RDM66_01495 [Stenotrophomonas maltophilia]
MNLRLRALLLSLLLAPATVLAQQTAERSAAYEVETGDRWVDAQLQDINHYAAAARTKTPIPLIRDQISCSAEFGGSVNAELGSSEI